VEPDEAHLEELFKMSDANNDGTISVSEMPMLFAAVDHMNIETAARIYKFIGDHSTGSTGSLLMQGVMSQHDSAEEILLIHRDTGLMVSENIPQYIKVALKGMYDNALGRTVTGLSSTQSILTKLSIKKGIEYDDVKSCADIHHFVELHNLNLDEVEKPIGEYKTFNEFFARGLKPSARPVECPNDDRIAVSPADCRMMVFENVVEATEFW
jgi:hypothetical protein